MKITNYTIDRKLNKEYKILFLSDFHDRKYEKMKPLIESLNFDFIVITGDLVDTKIKESKNAISFLKYLLSFNKNIYYSLGNHEYLFDNEDIEYLKDLGINVLNNEFIKYDENLMIGGLTSSGILDNNIKNKNRNMRIKPYTEWIKNYEDDNSFKILLSHHPEYYSKYLKNYNLDLVLSGHAHGGQIRLFNRGLFSPGQGIFPKYTKGIYFDKLIVSTGLKNTGIIVPRLFNETEIILITLK